MYKIRARWMLLASLAMSVIASRTAWAEYSGLTVELHNTVSINGGNYDVWRVYADFSHPGDRLIAGFGSQNYGPITLQTRNGDDSDFGNPFFNVGNNITAPSLEQIGQNAAYEWDTFVTIGTPISDLVEGGDQTSLSPGFAGVTGTNWVQDNMLWYAIPTIDHDNNQQTPDIVTPQTIASWQGDGDAQNRVLMLQLTVNAGDNVRGTINLGWYLPEEFGGHEQQIPIQTFNSFTVPAPGALVLLGLVALASRRRRLGA